jgi:hypothetical protein
MRVICSYCGFLYDLKEPFEDDSISHGCCEECWPWVEHNLNIELEQLESPSGPEALMGRRQKPFDRRAKCDPDPEKDDLDQPAKGRINTVSIDGESSL